MALTIGGRVYSFAVGISIPYGSVSDGKSFVRTGGNSDNF